MRPKTKPRTLSQTGGESGLRSFAISVILVFSHFIGGGDFRRVLDGGYLSFGMYLSICAALLAPYLIIKRGWSRFGVVLLSLPIYLALVVSQARGALLFTIAVFLLLVVSYWPKSERKTKTASGISQRIGLMALVGLLAVYFIPARTYARLNRLFFEDDGENARWHIWSDAWEEILASPIIGHGFGHYRNIGEVHPHNLFLQAGMDAGFIGILLLFIVIFFPIFIFLKECRFRIREYPPALVGIFAAYLVMILEHSKSADLYAGRSLFVLGGFLLAYTLSFSSRRRKLRSSQIARQRGRPLPAGPTADAPAAASPQAAG